MSERQKVYHCIAKKCGKELTDEEIKLHQIFCTDCSALARREGSKNFNPVFELDVNMYNEERSKRSNAIPS